MRGSRRFVIALPRLRLRQFRWPRWPLLREQVCERILPSRSLSSGLRSKAAFEIDPVEAVAMLNIMTGDSIVLTGGQLASAHRPAILHGFARVNVGPQRVARNSVKLLGGQHVFGRQLARRVNDPRHRRLRDVEVATHLAIGASGITTCEKRFIASWLIIHMWVAAHKRVDSQPTIS